jgi:hypothetical protein
VAREAALASGLLRAATNGVVFSSMLRDRRREMAGGHPRARGVRAGAS